MSSTWSRRLLTQLGGLQDYGLKKCNDVQSREWKQCEEVHRKEYSWLRPNSSTQPLTWWSMPTVIVCIHKEGLFFGFPNWGQIQHDIRNMSISVDCLNSNNAVFEGTAHWFCCDLESVEPATHQASTSFAFEQHDTIRQWALDAFHEHAGEDLSMNKQGLDQNIPKNSDIIDALKAAIVFDKWNVSIFTMCALEGASWSRL